MGECTCIYPLLGLFLSMDSLQDTLPMTSFISDVNAKLRIINRRFPGLETDSPCRVWVSGRTTCFLYDDALLALCFNWLLVCKFGMIERTFLLISCLFYALPKFNCRHGQPFLAWYFDVTPKLMHLMHFLIETAYSTTTRLQRSSQKEACRGPENNSAPKRKQAIFPPWLSYCYLYVPRPIVNSQNETETIIRHLLTITFRRCFDFMQVTSYSMTWFRRISCYLISMSINIHKI